MSVAWHQGAPDGEGLTARSAVVQRAAVPALVALAVGATAAPWASAFAIDGTVGALVAAATMSVAVPVAAAALGWSAPRSFVAGALGLVSLAVVATSLAGGSSREAATDLLHAPARLLSETLPVTGPAGAVALPVLLVWLTGAAAGELTARTSSPVAPVVPALVGFVAAHGLTAGGPPAHPASAGAFALAILAIVGLRQAGQDEDQAHVARRATASDRSSHRRLAAGLAGAVAFAVAGTALAELAPPSRPEPVAPARAVPVAAPTVDDPIGVLASLRELEPDLGLYDVELDGPTRGYLTVAGLDRYDGDAWSFERTFVPTGGRIPLEPSTPPPGPGRATLSVEVLEGGSRLGALPYLERPLEVTGLAVDHDPATGMLRPAAPPQPGARFEVVAATSHRLPSELDGRALVGSPVAADTALPPDLEPHLEAVLGRLEARTGEVAAPTLRFLEAVAEELRTTARRVEPPGTGTGGTGGERAVQPTRGTSYAAVTTAVLAQRRGQPEQFATLVALVARSLGVPARVATGFRLRPLDAAGPAPEGALTLTPAQAWTWVEVPVEGEGWVVLDPTPVATGEVQEETFATTSTTATTAPAAANAVPDPRGGNAVADPVELDRPAPRSRWSVGLLVAAAVAALAAAGALARTAYRRGRQAVRRRRGSPRRRVRAAWWEVLARLRPVGLGSLDSATASEVADRVWRRFGPEAGAAAQALAATFNAATYTAADVTDDDAARAWTALEVVRRAVDRQTALPTRVAEARRRRAERSRRMGHAPPVTP